MFVKFSRVTAILVLALLVSAEFRAANASLTLIFGNGTDASFTGSLEVPTASSTTATIKVLLNNTSPFDARITGFGFNVPSPGDPSGVDLAVDYGTLKEGDWWGDVDVNRPSGPGTIDVAGITSNPNGNGGLGGGAPNSGIPNEANDPGTANPALFTLVLSGSNLNLLTETSILDAGFYVRFQRTGANGNGSTLLMAQPNPVPEPSTIAMALTALVPLGFVALRRHRRRSDVTSA